MANLPMANPGGRRRDGGANADFGFGGFEVGADVAGEDLDDPRFDPIWEEAEELEMTVILHPHG